MSEIVSISIELAIEYLNYNGPVFQRQGTVLDPHHEDYPPLKAALAALYHQGGFSK